MGIIVIDEHGSVVKTTFDAVTTDIYRTTGAAFCAQARAAVRTIDPENDLKYVRMRTSKYEIMISPTKEYMLVVVQAGKDSPDY